MIFSFEDIRAGARWVCENARHVRVHPEKAAELVQALKDGENDPWFVSMPVKIEDTSFESALRFSVMFSSTSFCYWPLPSWRVNLGGKELGGSFSLTTCYAQAINQDAGLLSPEHWALMNLDEYLALTKVPSGNRIPLAEERLRALQSMGALISESYGNSMEAFVAGHDFDAGKILNTLGCNVYGFDDVHQFRGKTIPFLKRAQLAIADISSLCQKHSEKPLANAGKVTACPDYKLPQTMRHFGLISYAPELARKIDGLVELPSGSGEEIEIRAATIHGVEVLRQLMKDEGKTVLSSSQVSDQIWLLSQNLPEEIKPHHRTMTVYY